MSSGAALPVVPDVGESDCLTLRDGSAVHVHVAGPAERAGMADFFRRLSPESRWRRFLSPAMPRPELIAALCDSSRPEARLTLVATRIEGGATRIVATGSYLAKDARTAEVALAVADGLQGKGLGTLLLERLARSAMPHGFTHFWALTRADNQPMLDVFRDSGFAETENPDRGEVEVDLALLNVEEQAAGLQPAVGNPAACRRRV
jgi:GNAT superfamily N-acetyltransferase